MDANLGGGADVNGAAREDDGTAILPNIDAGVFVFPAVKTQAGEGFGVVHPRQGDGAIRPARRVIDGRNGWPDAS